MKKFNIKYGSMFFVANKGAQAYNQKDATAYTQDEANKVIESLKLVGYQASAISLVEVLPVSHSVVYIRKGDTSGTQVYKQTPNANLGQTDPSSRRFATRNEAIAHGQRFHERVAKAGDKPGTAGHIGYFLIETNDPVNATVNPLTGKTNSL